MKAKFIFILLFGFQQINSQNKLYINLATHNEMLDEFYDTNESAYNAAKTVCNQILNEITNVDGKWNFQTCSKFVLACLNWENAFQNPNDLLERMYISGHVEIDPRNKTQVPLYMYNISDVYHLLDSCGVTSTHTVGGFLHYPYENEDWTQFRNVKFGAVYGLPWQAEIIWGGGSPNHIQDANNYGVWKPKDGDSEANFYTHEPNSDLWLVGNGCAPVIYDTTTNVQWIVNLIRSNIEKIQNGIWPTDKFYSLTVMTNVKHFSSPNYFQKVRTVCDSIQAFVAKGGAEWASITEKLAHFQTWATANSETHSMWSCEEAILTTSVANQHKKDLLIYPNPFSDFIKIEGEIETLFEDKEFEFYTILGKLVASGKIDNNNEISTANLEKGSYLLRIDQQIYKVLKE